MAERALSLELIKTRHPHAVSVSEDRSTDATEGELQAGLERMLASASARDGVWIFPYGSLLWKPAIPVGEVRKATVHGWHRRFCLRQIRSRGSPDRPCLMMALDRGGACRSVVQRVEAADLHAALWPLWRREMRGRGYHGRWVRARTAEGHVTALTFVARREGARYVGGLTLSQAAGYLASACGPRGACAEYLLATVEALEALGLRDRNLWRLQGLVADDLVGAVR
ncbi:MAG: gamma-glutamylcyclotransferase [Pseudomonadota bacterium]